MAERADHLLTQHTQDVTAWNTTIDQQYALFEANYLWTPSATAFAGGVTT